MPIMQAYIIVVTLMSIANNWILCSAIYDPNWQSIDSRPLPLWYDEAKFGIFMHWSMWSVPSYGSNGAHEAAAFWMYLTRKNPTILTFMKENYSPGFTYQDFAAQFHAELFNADKFAEIIKKSGARYFVFTSKHHEGYTMWPSNYSWNWNSFDVGPKRDIVSDLHNSIVKIGNVHFGLYFSQFEWFNRLYLKDKAKNHSTTEYVQQVSIPQMHEIINTYKPDVVWSDGDWDTTSDYWNSTQFLAWLYNDSPVKDTVVVNDRWGKGIPCHHGGFWTCSDKFDAGHFMPHKWEDCIPLDRKSWGFRRNMQSQDVLSVQSIIRKLARAIRYCCCFTKCVIQITYCQIVVCLLI